MTKKLTVAIKASLAVLILFLIFSITASYASVSVGDSYGGGTVFCVSQTPDITRCVPEGSGNYGLIMANEDQANYDSNSNHGVTWYSAFSEIGALSDDDGAANTAAIIAALPRDNPGNNAAWLCHNYRDQEGHADWYLPSKNELNKMYIYAETHNLIGKGCSGGKPGGVQCLVGGYNDDKRYWSSTEYSGYEECYDAWYQHFSDGFQHYRDSEFDSYLGVRAVRAFIDLPIKPFNNLPQSQIQQAVDRFTHEAEETGSVDIAKLQEMLQATPDTNTILSIFAWLKTNSTVRILNLAHIDLSDLIEPLSDLIATRTDLTTINLINCNLGAESISRLFSRDNRELTTLYLRWNNIGNEGARILAEVLPNNTALTMLDLGGNQIGEEGVRAINVALVDNYSLFPLCVRTRNNLLLKLLRKIKRASVFTFTVGFHRTTLRDILPNILGFAGLNAHNRTAFDDVQDYNTENNRRIIFGGTLEEIIRLFYYGNRADYVEIIREVNQIRRLQREILQENHREIPAGLLLELELPGSIFWLFFRIPILTPERVAAAFWPAS